jgi:hypothetical protein
MRQGGLHACRSLDLSDNALGEKGVRACAAAISSQVNALPHQAIEKYYSRSGKGWSSMPMVSLP